MPATRIDAPCLDRQHEFRWAERGRTHTGVVQGFYYCVRCLFELETNEALSWRREVLGVER